MTDDSLTVNYTRYVEPASVGMDPEKLRKVLQVFTEQIDQQKLHPAAQLVVLRRGQPVVDLAYGKGRSGKNISPDTPFFTFSVTKAFTGVCVHHLIEQGQLSLEDRVADYWPEFGQKGKETATLRHVFLHQAGIPAPHLNQQVLRWPSWPRVTRHIARTAAVTPPGEQTAYHLVNYGFILGEVVRRVTGMPIDRYLEVNFLKPLELHNTWMRIPRAEVHRSPRLFSDDRAYDSAVFLFNLPRYRRALLPAASLHSTARDLAIFYQMLLNGGAYGGRRYLKTETVQTAISPGYEGMDDLYHQPMRYAYGFHLQNKFQTKAGDWVYDMGAGASPRAFGHYGMASSMVFADPEADLVVAFTCNRLIKNHEARNAALLEPLWESIL